MMFFNVIGGGFSSTPQGNRELISLATRLTFFSNVEFPATANVGATLAIFKPFFPLVLWKLGVFVGVLFIISPKFREINHTRKFSGVNF